MYYIFLVLLRGMQDLSYPARDGTHAPCTENSSLNHWTTREVPADLLRRGGKEGRARTVSMIGLLFNKSGTTGTQQFENNEVQ